MYNQGLLHAWTCVTPSILVHMWNIRRSKRPLGFGRGWMQKIPTKLQHLPIKLYGVISQTLTKLSALPESQCQYKCHW